MDYIFIKEGFSLGAALLGPFWLLIKGNWPGAGMFFALLILISIALNALGFNAAAITGLLFAVQIAFGFFARDLQRFDIERRGYRFIDIVNGKNLDECETRFFRMRQESTQPENGNS